MTHPQDIAEKFPAEMYGRHRAISLDSILLAFRGSVAHGTYEPNTDPNSIDDIDLMGIAVPSLEHYFGLRQFGSRGTVEIVEDPWDIVVYEARKAINLLAKGNPNVLSLLWLPPEHYFHIEDAGRYLIGNKSLFATKVAAKAFVGYARGQFVKMSRLNFEGYMGEKRKRLVQRFGYDTKNAAHAIRILRQGIHFLKTGDLETDRTDIDADELLEIKHGKWGLERIKKYTEYLFVKARYAEEHSPLPDRPDMDAINRLAVSVIAIANPAQ